MGCLPQRWPIWFRPELVEMDEPAIGLFPASHSITRDGTILMVPTPGHFYGHTSVIVRDADITYFLAGDATYTEANLRADRVDGVTYDPSVSLATLRAIKAFAARGADDPPPLARSGWTCPPGEPHHALTCQIAAKKPRQLPWKFTSSGMVRRGRNEYRQLSECPTFRSAAWSPPARGASDPTAWPGPARAGHPPSSRAGPQGPRPVPADPIRPARASHPLGRGPAGGAGPEQKNGEIALCDNDRFPARPEISPESGTSRRSECHYPFVGR